MEWGHSIGLVSERNNDRQCIQYVRDRIISQKHIPRRGLGNPDGNVKCKNVKLWWS